MNTPEVNYGAEETVAVKCKIKEFAKDCKLEILYAPEDGVVKLSTVSVNRPGLILAGFDDYFAASRLQVMGNAEMYFLYKMSDEDCDKAVRNLTSHKIPCIIISRGLSPTKNMLKIAQEQNCPVFRSQKITSELVTDLINFLADLLAPRKDLHGELLDVEGMGVLILGNSGIGKSETALELIHRGHQLVADDSVEVKRVKDEIVGYSLPSIRDFLEVRGVGIINVRNMYGIAGVLPETRVDLVIELEKLDETKPYERLGDKFRYENVLGVDIPKLVIPVMPGRNIAIIVEVAAKNVRLKQLGFDALEELQKRVFDKN